MDKYNNIKILKFIHRINGLYSQRLLKMIQEIGMLKFNVFIIKGRLIFFIFLTLLFSTSCNDEQLSEPGVNSQYKLWLSKNIHNYTIDQMRSCFCLYAGALVRITVRSDTIFNMVRISDNTKVISPYYFTIDSLFGIINNSKNDSLVIKYNSIYGYPEYLDINPQLHPVDGGVLYETSNLNIQ